MYLALSAAAVLFFLGLLADHARVISDFIVLHCVTNSTVYRLTGRLSCVAFVMPPAAHRMGIIFLTQGPSVHAYVCACPAEVLSGQFATSV